VIEPLAPRMLRALDPGIRRLVAALREADFDTTDSGDGVSKPEVGRVFNVSHVFMVVESGAIVAEAHRLVETLGRLGVRVKSGVVQAQYDPADGVATLAVFCVNDAMLAEHGR
jgi:hypothetical protein